MRRALFILLAVLTVMLVYPTTTPSAKSPNAADRPSIYIVTPQAEGGPLARSGGSDEGDGDDLSGLRDGRGITPDLGSGLQNKAGTKVWWIYLAYWFRL